MRGLLLAVGVLVPFLPTGNHDGDTFTGRVASAVVWPGEAVTREFTIRLQCPLSDGGYYNAPELRADGGGLVETLHLRAWLSADGGHLLKTSWEREKYGRTLGEPWHGDAGFCSTLGPL